MSRKRKNKGASSILKDFTAEVAAKKKIGKFVLNPKGEVSMSDAISQLIEPYKDDAPDYNSFSKLVSLACVAWNTSILPQEKQDEAINKIMTVFQGKIDLGHEVLGLLTELMDGKRKLFPNVSRMIIEYKVTDQGNNFHIAVASTMDKKNA